MGYARFQTKRGFLDFARPMIDRGPPVGSDHSPYRANQSSMTFDYQKGFSVGLSL
jgi:hypothetical protein